MKNLVLALVAMFGLTMSAQSTNFVSVGHSFGSGKLITESYPSIEVGYTKSDVSYSVVFGCGGVHNMDLLSNYFLEYKIVPSTSFGNVSLGLVVGAGAFLGNSSLSNYNQGNPSYAKSKPYFGEIGGVISYKVSENYSVGVSYTNWDSRNYITPSLSYSF